jgi:hypothetical protein
VGLDTIRRVVVIVPHEPELGDQKQCSHCHEWWPADGEFYYGNRRTADGWHSWCKACFRERYRTVYVTRKRPRRFATREEAEEARRQRKRDYDLRRYHEDPEWRAKKLARTAERNRLRRAAA